MTYYIINHQDITERLSRAHLIHPLDLTSCQEWNYRGQKNRVIDKSTLWNGVMYYIGGEYYLAIV